MVIVAGSLLYTNHLVRKIAKVEKLKVRLWADAIQKKAKLLEYTQELFTKLENEERKKVELFAKAWQKLSKSDINDSELLSFMLDLNRSNETVPVILADDNGKIILKTQ